MNFGVCWGQSRRQSERSEYYLKSNKPALSIKNRLKTLFFVNEQPGQILILIQSRFVNAISMKQP